MIIKRLMYSVLIVIIILLGLGSRVYAEYLPNIVAKYSGDALWAIMIFFLFRFIYVNKESSKLVKMSLAFCYLIELSQLYHSNWIDSIRSTILGRLVLGQGFLWTDLVCYSFGVMLGLLIDKYINRLEVI